MLLTISSISIAIQALDRPLEAKEVKFLEDKLKVDPDSKKARSFLRDHYSLTKNWTEVDRLTRPLIKDINRSQKHIMGDKLTGASLPEAALFYLMAIEQPNAATHLILAQTYAVKTNLAKDPVTAAQSKELTIEHFKKSLAMNPKQTAAYESWIDFTLQQTSILNTEVLTLLEKYKKHHKLTARHLQLQCEIFEQNNFASSAISACQDVIEKGKGNDKTHLHLARAQLAVGEKENYKSALSKALKNYPKSHHLHREMAEFQFKERNYKNSEEHYKSALSQDPNNPKLYLGLANTLYEAGKKEEALTAYSRNCFLARKAALPFKLAPGRLRQLASLKKKYETALQTCIYKTW